MDNIVELMADDHRNCDGEFAAIERAANQGDWVCAVQSLKVFCEAMERHLTAEETVLFPAFEAASGTSMGPTRVMRMEHAQLRSLFDDLRTAVESADPAAFRGQAETLLIMMQQHNLKEENILYPMCDQQLAGHADWLHRQLADAVRRTA